MQAIHAHHSTAETREAVYNLFAAYLHTVPLSELIDSFERARRDAQLRYVVIYGAACSYCLARAERLDGSYLRTFAVELKEQLAQALAAFVTSMLTQPRRRLDAVKTSGNSCVLAFVSASVSSNSRAIDHTTNVTTPVMPNTCR